MWKFLLSLPVIWAITASTFHGTANGKSHGACNVTLKLKQGAFYPNITANETSFFCFYEITGTPFNGSVCLFFNSLFMDEGDEVLFYENKTDAESDVHRLVPNPIKTQNGSVTVVTGLSSVFVVVKGPKSNYVRNFEGFYSHECISPVPPDVTIINSPIYAVDAPDTEVHYVFSMIQHMRVKRVFTFLEFNIVESKVEVEGATCPSSITNNPPTDFFANDSVLTLKVSMKPNSTENYILKVIEVDDKCSGIVDMDGEFEVLRSPDEVLNNGTIVNECRWLVSHKDSHKILGLKFDTLDFHSVFDIVSVNDGLSETSPPLLQVTTSNKNVSKNQVMRSGSTGPYMWIAFKPLHYASRFVANVSAHGQGGYMKNEGNFSMTSTVGNDTVFLLEVKDGEVVMLTFEDSSLTSPATLSIYDDFESNNLLATFHGPIKVPVLSKSSRMMVIGTQFSDKTNHFSASFKGVMPSCNQTSTLSSANYILSENCNSTCTWVIPPQDVQNSELILYLQYRSLKEADKLEIHQLDASLTPLGLITSNMGYIPPIAVPADVGAVITVTQGACKSKTGKIVLIAHSSILPGRKFDIIPKPSEELLISSPLYPDTYPVFSSIQWNITASKGPFLHLAFQSMKLAQNHSVRISGKDKKYEFDGDILPDDLFVTGDVIVQFDSSNCDKKPCNLSLMADTGFQLSVTVPECGQVLTGKTGEFNTSVTGNQTVCIWKIDVTDRNSVNTVSYSVKQDSLKNYNLTVYDGASVRDMVITNNTISDIWSRSSVLIVKYTRLNVSEKSSVLVFKYITISCNETMQCDNHRCMHPDWRCNGHNDCGDYSDERNCATVPIPKNVTYTGYSSLSFWMCIFTMLIIGVLAGLTGPVCYQKWKDSRYSRFRELSGIDG